MDECVGNPCQNNGTCVDLVADYVCRCVDGWKGRTCSNRHHHCLNGDSPCLNGATCVEDSDPDTGFTCRCTNGWRGSICHLGNIVFFPTISFIVVLYGVTSTLLTELVFFSTSSLSCQLETINFNKRQIGNENIGGSLSFVLIFNDGLSVEYVQQVDNVFSFFSI